MKSYLIVEIKTILHRGERHLHVAIRMRREPCVYLPARLLVVPENMFCRSLVLPLPSPGTTFAPSTPGDPLAAVALSENMDRPWQYCRRNRPASPRGMIYAAAFHIFHCFQVFGSICKIKFVMREHSLPSHTPFLSASSSPRRSSWYSSPRRHLRRAHESRRIWPTGQFPRVLKHRHPDVACYETRFFLPNNARIRSG